MSNKDKIVNEDKEITALRDRVLKVFPSERYEGKVTAYDDGPWTEELDEEQLLFEQLKGRGWTEISPDLLHQRPDGYVFLTTDAFAAFIAAWLLKSLDDSDLENTVREYLIYTYERDRAIRYLAPLNLQQRSVIKAIMAHFGDCERNDFIRKAAQNAAAHIDELLAKL